MRKTVCEPERSGSIPSLWFLALLTFSGTSAIHIFVPALAMAGQSLRCSPGAMQGAVSFYVLGLAAGQLVYGPASDRFGRRPILTFGLCVYTLAGAAAALAPTIHVLLLSRLLQAFGGSAGLVLARAIVRDTSAPDTVTRRLALMNLMVVVGPGLAPLLGTLLTALAGWRSVLASLVLLGVANLFLVQWQLRGFDRLFAQRQSGPMLAPYAVLLQSRAFVGYCIGGGCATTSIYAFIAAAPFILTERLHDSPAVTGWVLAGLLAGMWLGNVLTGRLVARVPVARIMLSANMLSLVMAIAFLLAASDGILSTPLIVALLVVFMIGAGMTSPAAMTEALGVEPRLSGSASGLYGCAQMAFGALCSTLSGLGGSTALAAAATMAGASAVSQIAFRIALAGYRRPRFREDRGNIEGAESP